MKYMTMQTSGSRPSLSVTTTVEEENFVSFPAAVGNPNYDQFLEQAKLTDKQVKALTPDTWYDFPKE